VTRKRHQTLTMAQCERWADQQIARILESTEENARDPLRQLREHYMAEARRAYLEGRP